MVAGIRAFGAPGFSSPFIFLAYPFLSFFRCKQNWKKGERHKPAFDYTCAHDIKHNRDEVSIISLFGFCCNTDEVNNRH